jgi:hypothetical protein
MAVIARIEPQSSIDPIEHGHDLCGEASPSRHELSE